MGDGLADTLNVLTSKLQLHVVEIIGNYTYRANRTFQQFDETLNVFIFFLFQVWKGL